jgi:hypothetical protein
MKQPIQKGLALALAILPTFASGCTPSESSLDEAVGQIVAAPPVLTCGPHQGGLFQPCCKNNDLTHPFPHPSTYACPGNEVCVIEQFSNPPITQCEPCGQPGAACCCPVGVDPATGLCIGGLTCGSGAVCDSSGKVDPAVTTCLACGGPGQPCCTGSVCNAGATCDAASGQCLACGGEGQACCPDGSCSSGSYCYHSSIAITATGVCEPSSCGMGGQACCGGVGCYQAGAFCNAGTCACPARRCNP